MTRQPFDDFCETLSIVTADSGVGGRIKALAAWPAVRWEPVIELASRHFVLPSIAARLADDDAAAILDPALLAFFREIHTGNSRRNRDLLEAAERCCALANLQGVQPILMKGTAHLADGVYGDPGARYVADIDLLVGEDLRERLHHALLEVGYRPLASDDKDVAFWADHHHAAPLLGPNRPFVVEIHSDTLREGGAIFDLDAQGVAARAIPHERNGAAFRLPCLEDRVVHCLAHNQLGHNARFVSAIEMRDLLDLHALTGQSSCPEALWTQVLARFERAGHGDMATGLLHALQVMVPEARLGPHLGVGAGDCLRAARYLRPHRQSRLSDPTLYADLMRREWHRLGTLKAYRRQLWSHAGDLTYWYRRWRNLLDIIRRP